MNSARSQFFARAAFSGDQHSRLTGRDLGDKLIDLPHQSAFTHHVVLDICVSKQSLVFALQHFNVPNVLDRYCGDRRDSCNQLQVIFVKLNIRFIGIQVNHAHGLLEHDERHA